MRRWSADCFRENAAHIARTTPVVFLREVVVDLQPHPTRNIEHIGIMANETTVVEASEGSIGVVTSVFKAAKHPWTRVGRIRDKAL